MGRKERGEETSKKPRGQENKNQETCVVAKMAGLYRNQRSWGRGRLAAALRIEGKGQARHANQEESVKQVRTETDWQPESALSYVK